MRAARFSISRLSIGAACLLVLSGCSGSAPTPPTAPASTLTTIVGLAIAGLANTLSVSQSVQLTAMAVLANGESKAVADSTWTSSNSMVATVSPAGHLIVTGPGDANVTATFQGMRDVVHIVVSKPVPSGVTYTLTGIVHETAPTEGMVVAGATVGIHFVGCPTCPHDNQTTTTDNSGRFTLPGIETPGFMLVVSKPGYDNGQYGVVALPRDQVADIALSPTLQTVTDDLSGVSVCRPGSWLQNFPVWTFPVHHSGRVQLLIAENVGWGSTSIELRQLAPGGYVISSQQFPGLIYSWDPQGRPFFSAGVPLGGSSLSVLGGFRYQIVFGDHADLTPCSWAGGVVRGVWTRPS